MRWRDLTSEQRRAIVRFLVAERERRRELGLDVATSYRISIEEMLVCLI
jgi:hypothetical protein